jgi:hydroxyacylglutathione hydrolase
MEKLPVIQLHIGSTNPVLISNGDQYILTDAGVPGKMTEFHQQFKLHGVNPEKIKLIVLTHTHYDHTGNLEELRALTGARVIVNQREAGWLRKGLMPIPRGTNFFSKILVGLGDFLMPGFASPRPFEADIFVDKMLDLSPWGFDARIILTPGHTEGSQSILTGSSLIGGDCFFNMRFFSVFPPFANDPDQLLETWRKLFEMGIETIYPGHGPRFGVEKAKEEYWKRIKI